MKTVFSNECFRAICANKLLLVLFFFYPFSTNVFAAHSDGQGCNSSSDCNGHLVCRGQGIIGNICVRHKNRTTGQPCTNSGQCAGALTCDGGDNICRSQSGRNIGDICSPAPGQCRAPYVCVDFQCTTKTNRVEGMPCADASDCKSGYLCTLRPAIYTNGNDNGICKKM